MTYAGPERRGETPPLTAAQRRFVLTIVTTCTGVLTILVVAVFMQSYYGREDVVHAARGGCERSKLDRRANAAGWRTAEVARRASGTAADRHAADRYARIAASLEARSRVDCAKAFPAASFNPFGQ